MRFSLVGIVCDKEALDENERREVTLTSGHLGSCHTWPAIWSAGSEVGHLQTGRVTPVYKVNELAGPS